MSKSRIYRRGVLMVTAGVMTVSLFCLTLAVVAALLLGVENIALGRITDEDYYLPQSAAITRRVTDLTVRCELPEEIVDGVFDSDEILAFTKAYTADRLKGFDTTLNTAPVGERLRANLYNYMEEHEISMASLDMDALNSYLSQSENLYSQTVNSGLILHYHSLRRTVIAPAIGGAFASLVILILCLIFMYRVTGMRRKVLSYTIRALLATAFLCAALAIWHFALGGSLGGGYSPEYMGQIYRDFESFFFLSFGAAAGIWLLAAAGCAAGIEALRHRTQKK